MNILANFISWIFDSQPTTQEGDERYLCGAVDIADLERRMRMLDERRSVGPFGQGA